MSQTAYSVNMGGLYAGALADAESSFRIRSYVNSQGASIPFGVMLKKDTSADQKAKLPSAATDQFLGFNVHMFGRNPGGGASNTSLAGANGTFDGDTMALLAYGNVMVLSEQDVTPADDVYVRITSDGGSNTQLGSIRKDNDSGRAVLLKGAKFVRTSVSKLVEVFFDAAVQQAAGDEVEMVFDQASTNATATKKEFVTRADRFFIVDSIGYTNVTGLAADASNYFVVEAKQGSTSLGTWSTLTGAQGAIGADTPLELVMAAAANRIVPPGTIISSVLTKTGTQTLPAGRMMLRGHYV